MALNTSAAGNAGAQAGLIAQMLETAEEDLLVLQKKQETNATELATLKEKKTGLEAAEKTATGELDESDATRKDSALQGKAAEAKSNLEINGNEISAAERQKTTLEGQIARKNQQIATLTVAFGEAAAVDSQGRDKAGSCCTDQHANHNQGWSFESCSEVRKGGKG